MSESYINKITKWGDTLELYKDKIKDIKYPDESVYNVNKDYKYIKETVKQIRIIEYYLDQLSKIPNPDKPYIDYLMKIKEKSYLDAITKISEYNDFFRQNKNTKSKNPNYEIYIINLDIYRIEYLLHLYMKNNNISNLIKIAKLISNIIPINPENKNVLLKENDKYSEMIPYIKNINFKVNDYNNKIKLVSKKLFNKDEVVPYDVIWKFNLQLS
jgi:hypothetical protein